MIGLDYLKDNVRNIQRLIAAPPLREFETEELKKSLRLSRIAEYDHGELIVQGGDPYPCVYFLLSGTVRTEKQGTEARIIGKSGEIFGELETLEDLAVPGSVYAEEKAVCLAVNTPPGTDRPTPDEIADILLLLYRTFMEFSAIRLRLVNDKVVRIKKDMRRSENRSDREEREKG